MLCSLALLANSCAVTIPNTRACAVAGIMEAGMDCAHTLDDDMDEIPAAEIKDFLEARPEVKDAKGNVIQQAHGAAICQPMVDWGLEHAALEQACEKLGTACSYDLRKIIDSVTGKINNLGKMP